MQLSRTQSTIRNTVMGIFARVINIVARFVLQTTLIYVLGIQYAGVSGLFSSILVILSLAELGIGNAITYELYKPLAEENWNKIATLLTFFKIAYRFVAFVILVIGLAFIPFLNFFIKDVPEIKEDIVLLYILYIVKTVVSYLLIYKSTLLNANQQNYVVSRIQAIATLSKTIFECLILLITKEFILYLIVEIVSIFMQNIFISYKVDRQYPELAKYKGNKIDKKEREKLLKDIKGLAMYKASYALGTGVDNIIVSAFVNTSAVGLLSNYSLIRNELEQMIKQFFNAIIPSVGNLSVTESEDKQQDIFSKLLFFSFWIGNVLSVMYFNIIQSFITLWLGKEYLLSVPIAATISLDFYLACMLDTVASFRTANGIFVKGQYRPLIMVIINVILSVIWGSQMGILGVLLATVVSRLVTQWYDPFLLYKIVFKRKAKAYFIKYYTYMGITVLSVTITYVLIMIGGMQNSIIDIMFRICLCLVIPNIIIVLLYKNSPEFLFVCKQIEQYISKLLRRKR